MNNLEVICLDASLVMRLLLAESTETSIVQLWQSWLLEGNRLVAPKLLHYEVTNALYKYVHHGQMSPDESFAALRSVFQLGIAISDDFTIHQAALAFAKQWQLPATYDAHYLALAERLGADFWTADKRLVNSLPDNWNWIHLWVA